MHASGLLMPETDLYLTWLALAPSRSVRLLLNIHIILYTGSMSHRSPQNTDPAESSQTLQHSSNVSTQETKKPAEKLLWSSAYPSLAERKASNPPSAIFRRFSSLSIQSLLAMQAKLLCQEKELKELQSQSQTSTFQAGKTQDHREKQSELMREICDNLKDYRTLNLAAAHWTSPG